MANRDITVRIKAEIGAFKRDMAAAADAAKKTADATEKAGQTAESGIGKLAQTAQTHEKAWGQVSSGMVVSGTAIVGALALTGKAAMDWQSQWTGVTKTVDGTPAQLAEVEGGLRNLAKTLPSTHAEIAGVAEAAGQLGVARDDITGFTKTMIDLGETTNLTAEDAATNIAQISNVMGTMEREGSKGVERFGSALVALGNDGASTEADILSMAQRIAGAGASLNASEADVLALSNTLASMGVRAELGGGVATRVLLKMRTAVDEGGESLESFATVAGTSADEFAAKFSSSPMEALQLVAEGIARTNDAGGNLTATLSEMGIKGTEETQVMLALANSGDLLTESLELGAKAWEENSALVEEANKRYETAESRIAIAWNNIKDAAIDAGAVILPAIATMADAVAELASWFGDLPAPVQTALTVLGGVSGVGLLAAGGLMKIVGALGDTIPKMQALGIDTPKATRAISGLSKVLGGVTVVGAGILAGKVAIEAINDAVRSGKPDVEEYFNLIATGGNISEGLGLDLSSDTFLFPDTAVKNLKDYYGAHSEGAAAAKRALEFSGQNNFLQWMGTNLGMGDVRDAADDWLELSKAGEAIARAFSMGQNDLGVEAFKDLQSELELTDENVGTLINNVPGLKSALMSIATEGGIQIDPNDELGLVDLALGRIQASAPGAAKAIEDPVDGFQVLAEKAAAATEKVNDFYTAMVNAGMIVLGEREAMRALEESFAAATAAIEQNGATLDTTTEKGRANQAALDGIAEASFRAMEAQRANGAETSELAGTLAQGREAFIQNAVAMDMSEKAAGALADQIGLIPGNVYIAFDSNTDDLAGKLMEIHELVQSTPDGKVTIEENSPAVIAALEALGYIVTTLPDGKIQVSETGTDATGKKIDATAGKKRTAKINTEAATGAAESALAHLARDRFATIAVHTRYTSSGSSAVHRGGAGGQTGNFMGGKLPSRKDGGKLPYTGLGRDMILGVASDGRPVANVDDGEWVIREKSANKYDRVLGMINRDDPAVQHLSSFANGGAVGRAEKRVKDLQRQYSAIDSKQANKARKLAAKDQLDAAREELKAAKAQAKLSADAAKEAREKASRLSESRRDLRTDLRRGTIVDSFTGGSGLSQVDKLFEASRNSDLSRGARRKAARDAAGLEKALASLTKRSEGLEKALEAAKSKADELRSVRDAVANDLRGEFSLSGMLSDTRQDLGSNPFTARSISSKANKMARRIEIFAGRLNRLRKLGYGETIIQEIAALGTEDGILAAGALMDASKSERNNIIKAYDRLDDASGKAGQYVTESMYKGGLDAADGLVRGLESKTKNVEDAFYKLGKNAEKSFKRSLGIKSPSRVMFGAGVNVGEGAELGILSKVGAVESAAEKLMTPQAFTIPPAFEASRYASAQAAPIDYERLTNMVIAAARATPVEVPIYLDKTKLGQGIADIQKDATRGRPAAPFFAKK